MSGATHTPRSQQQLGGERCFNNCLIHGNKKAAGWLLGDMHMVSGGMRDMHAEANKRRFASLSLSSLLERCNSKASSAPPVLTDGGAALGRW